jgi:hypothetical protein
VPPTLLAHADEVIERCRTFITLIGGAASACGHGGELKIGFLSGASLSFSGRRGIRRDTGLR